jgi:hypothetical protein
MMLLSSIKAVREGASWLTVFLLIVFVCCVVLVQDWLLLYFLYYLATIVLLGLYAGLAVRATSLRWAPVSANPLRFGALFTAGLVMLPALIVPWSQTTGWLGRPSYQTCKQSVFRVYVAGVAFDLPAAPVFELDTWIYPRGAPICHGVPFNTEAGLKEACTRILGNKEHMDLVALQLTPYQMHPAPENDWYTRNCMGAYTRPGAKLCAFGNLRHLQQVSLYSQDRARFVETRGTGVERLLHDWVRAGLPDASAPTMEKHKDGLRVARDLEVGSSQASLILLCRKALGAARTTIHQRRHLLFTFKEDGSGEESALVITKQPQNLRSELAVSP